jgi:hypothetical protein
MNYPAIHAEFSRAISSSTKISGSILSNSVALLRSKLFPNQEIPLASGFVPGRRVRQVKYRFDGFGGVS